MQPQWRPDAVLRFLIGLLLAMMIGGLISSSMVAEGGSQDPDFVSLVLNNTMFYGVFFGLVHFFLKTHGVRWKDVYGLQLPHRRRAVAWGVGFGILVLLPVWLLTAMSELALKTLQLDSSRQITVETLIRTDSIGQRLSFGLMAVVLAPLVEELLFRGILYPTVKQFGHPRMALWGVSVFFAIFHNNLMTFVPLTLLAVGLTLLYERTGNLLAPISAHIVFNASNFSLLLVQKLEG